MKRLSYYLTVLLLAAVPLTLISCSDSSSVGGDFEGELELTGVRYQSPDSTATPQEVQPGDLIALEGRNLNTVAAVFFNGEEAGFNSALASNTNLVVTVPGDLPFGEMDPESETFNTIRVVNNSSEAQLDFSVLPPAPLLRGMSNEHAQPGTEVTLTGQYLYLIESITFADGTTISGDEVTSAADGSEVQFTLPASASTEEGPVSITTVAGSGTSDPAFFFHDRRGMILDADEVQNWQYWSAMHPDSENYAEQAAPFEDGAEGNFIIVQPEGEVASGDNAWWTSFRSINLNGAEWVPPASLDEPLDHFALKFEMAVNGSWETGTFQIFLPETEYAARYEPWRQEDGSVRAVSYDGWRTVSIPMNMFRTDGGSGNVVESLTALLGEDGVAGATDGGAPGFRLLNDTEGAIPAGLAFAIDNIRVVRIAE